MGRRKGVGRSPSSWLVHESFVQNEKLSISEIAERAKVPRARVAVLLNKYESLVDVKKVWDSKLRCEINVVSVNSMKALYKLLVAFEDVKNSLNSIREANEGGSEEEKVRVAYDDFIKAARYYRNADHIKFSKIWDELWKVPGSVNIMLRELGLAGVFKKIPPLPPRFRDSRS